METLLVVAALCSFASLLCSLGSFFILLRAISE